MFKKYLFILITLVSFLIYQPTPTSSFSAHTPLSLPIGQQTLKIQVDQSGIYTITYDDLIATGINIGQFNPQNLTMMHRGELVAVQFTGDGNDMFEANESLRFYGWEFDGSRYEQQFVRDNVYWLWSGDDSLFIEERENSPSGSPNPLTATREEITFEVDNDFFSGWTDQWDTFPNDPDAWYWARIPQAGSGAANLTIMVDIDLPHPVLNGANIELTSEWMSRAKSANPGAIESSVQMQLNDSPIEQLTWNGRRNVNLTQTISPNFLQTDNNQLIITANTPDVLYFNRATLTYDRQLKMADEPTLFTNAIANDMLVEMGETAVDNLILWDITNRHAPIQLNLNNNHLTQTGLRIGQSQNQTTTYFLTSQETIQTPVSLEKVTPVELTPVNQKGEWLVISHQALLSEANRLAEYRHTQDGFSTHVVDVQQIIDQFGYGFALPSAIRDYIKVAHDEWQEPPQFVLLMGDATLNPRQLDCQWSCAKWEATEVSLVPTDLRFVDRFQGLIPTDQTLGMLDDDLIPDVMIGRISAQTLSEAAAAVSKTIAYETLTTLQAHPAKEILFLADNTDAAGDFCLQNEATAQLLSGGHKHQNVCLPPNASQADVSQINASLFRQINGDGAYILNYRGHGSIQFWGGGDAILLSISEDFNTLGTWLNHHPTVIISADCLDGHFAWPGLESISETLLTLANSGTAAHWSSSGLGADSEHSLMHQAFYESFFVGDARRIGEAIRYAQTSYANSGLPNSPLYSFTLQGDPALKFDWVRYSTLFLPMVEG